MKCMHLKDLLEEHHIVMLQETHFESSYFDRSILHKEFPDALIFLNNNIKNKRRSKGTAFMLKRTMEQQFYIEHWVPEYGKGKIHA